MMVGSRWVSGLRTVQWLRALLLLLVLVVASTPSASGATGDDPDANTFDQVPAELVADFVDRYDMVEDIAREYIALTDEIRHWRTTARHELGETFGGVWRDPREDLKVNLNVTERGLDQAEELVEAFPRPELIELAVVPQSLERLEGAADEIRSDLPGLLTRGFEVATVGPDIPSGSVVVRLVNFSEHRADALRDEYTAMPLDVQQGGPMRSADDCGSRTNCTTGFPPWGMRGAIEIFSPNATCSTAFGAVRVADDRPMVLTAGHCFDGAEETFHGPFVSIGPVTRSQFRDTVDGAAVAPSEVTWNVENWVYSRDSIQHQPVTSVEGRNFTADVGDPVCQAGITLGRTCGAIEAVNQAIQVNDDGNIVLLTEQNFTDMCAIPGDSGGSVFTPTSVISGEAHGIISASNFDEENGQFVCDPDPFTSYPRAVNVENELGVLILVV